MNVKKFEEFLTSGTVKRQSPNKSRALSLIEESKKKKEFLEITLKSIPQDKMNANFIVEYSYDILVELLRAKMLADGLNSGNSHEAEVAYMANLGFLEPEVRYMNEIRYYRNGTKYYGTILSREYAQKVLTFMKETYPKLKEIVEQSVKSAKSQ